MINKIKGDLIKEVKSGIIVHGCNIQGSFGAGFALQIKEIYPEAYKIYRQAYNKNKLSLGTCISINISSELIVVNAMTQEYYGRERKRYVDYNAVRSCFKQIVDEQKGNIVSINFPLIGAGLGGGDWNIISKIIDEEVSDDFIKNLWVL